MKQNKKGPSSAVTKELARQLAAHRIADRDVKDLVKIIARDDLPRRLGVCAVGICVDHYVPHAQYLKLLESLISSRVHKVESFPLGTLNPELFRVRAEFNVNRG